MNPDPYAAAREYSKLMQESPQQCRDRLMRIKTARWAPHRDYVATNESNLTDRIAELKRRDMEAIRSYEQ